jgi:hypothetical protein
MDIDFDDKSDVGDGPKYDDNNLFKDNDNAANKDTDM